MTPITQYHTLLTQIISKENRKQLIPVIKDYGFTYITWKNLWYLEKSNSFRFIMICRVTRTKLSVSAHACMVVYGAPNTDKSRWATWNQVLISCISLNKIYLYIIYLLQHAPLIVKCSDLANSAIKNAFHSFFLLKNKWNMVFALPDLWKTFYYDFFKKFYDG